MGAVQAFAGAGEHGATLYADDGLPNAGVADLSSKTANNYVLDTYTWSLAIRDPAPLNEVTTTSDTVDDETDTAVWDWRTGSDPGS
jgi:hypothetical protein